MTTYLYAVSQAAFVRPDDMDYLKFGITDDLTKRLQNLQNGNPIALEYMASAEFPTRYDAEQAERRILKLAAPDKVQGEWFKFTLRVASVLDTLQEFSAFNHDPRSLAQFEHELRILEEKYSV